MAVGFAVRHFLYVWSRCAHGVSIHRYSVVVGYICTHTRYSVTVGYGMKRSTSCMFGRGVPMMLVVGFGKVHC